MKLCAFVFFLLPAAWAADPQCSGGLCSTGDVTESDDVSSMLHMKHELGIEAAKERVEDEEEPPRKETVFQRMAEDATLLETAATHLGVDISHLDLQAVQESIHSMRSAETFDPKDWFAPGSGPSEGAKKSKAQPSELMDTGKSAFKGLISVLDKAITAPGLTAADWAGFVKEKLVGMVTKAITDIGNKILSSFVSIIGSIFGGFLSLLFGLFGDPKPSTGELIKSALAKHRMQQNKALWRGLIDEMDWMPAVFAGTKHSDAKMAWLLIMQHDLALNKESVFSAACIDKFGEPKTSLMETDESLAEKSGQSMDIYGRRRRTTKESDECHKWIKDGMWEVMAPYGQLHLSVLWELATGVMTNPDTSIGFKQKQVEAITKRAKQVGAEYAHLLESAWKVFYPYRMTLIWHKHWSDKHGVYEHPFDFLHASISQGPDKLNRDPPVNVHSGQSEQAKQVNDWSYKGCSNRFCNLYQHVTSKENGGCGCLPGTPARRRTSNRKSLSTHAHACWTRCMNKYASDQENNLKKGFLDVVTDIKEFGKKLEFPPTLKLELQSESTQCDEQDSVSKAKCVEGFGLLKHPIAGAPVEVKNDANIPGGCSFRIKDGKAVYNEAKQSSSAYGYRPLCGALFFSANKGTPRAPAAAKPPPLPSPKPAPELAPKPVPQPAPKPAPQPAPKPVHTPVSKPPEKPAPRPTPKPAPRPAPRSAPKPARKPAPKLTPKPAAGNVFACKKMKDKSTRKACYKSYKKARGAWRAKRPKTPCRKLKKKSEERKACYRTYRAWAATRPKITR